MIKKIKEFLKKEVRTLHADEEIVEVIETIGSFPIEIVFDVGAHNGRFTDITISKFKSATFYLFEPFPQSFEFIKERFNSPKIYTESIALSDQIGKSIFYSNAMSETNSLLKSSKTNSPIDDLILSVNSIEVEVSTLDNYCAKKNIKKIDFLKIDTQGTTLNVLKGAGRMLDKRLIGFVQCEVEFIEIYQNQALFSKVAEFLESKKYHFYSLYNLHYDINGRLSWADALYVRDI